MDTTTRLSTKGQIILPKNIREAHALKPGAEFTVEETNDGILLRFAGRFPAVELDQVAGCLRSNRKAQSPAQMRDGVGHEVMRRHGSGRY